MNDNLPLTDDQLRLATSRALSASPQLDSEATAARDSFLSLGATVESAANNFDKSALLARLTKSCLESPSITLKPAQPNYDWLAPLLSTALAAAALLAIVRIATDSNSTTGPRVATVVPSDTVPTPTDSHSPQRTLAWNDPLDDEIALASATIQQYSTRNRTFDNSLLDMNDRLEALSQELSTDTL